VDGTWLPALLTLVAALTAAAVTYVLGNRGTEAETRTSDLQLLFDASESIRLALTSRVEAQEKQIAALENKVGTLQQRLERLEQLRG
jgi:uncharacterized protein YlxW (UPF0749 family)